MDKKKDTAASNEKAILPLKVIEGELDAIDGVIDQSRAVKHLSGTLSDMLQTLLRGTYRVKNHDTVNVTVLLSKGEIERILWIADNVKDRTEFLDDRLDVVYDAVQDVVREQRAAS